MWTNFHTHSRFCDGKGELTDFCEKANDLRLISLGFSSHAPLPFPCAWCMKPGMLGEYSTAIEGLRRLFPDLPIYKGLEVDFVPGTIGPADFSGQLDYTIGSIHFVDSFPDGRPWEIDGLHTLFLQGLESIFENDIRAAVTRYFALTRQMIETSCPAIVGHIDKIKIQNPGNALFDEGEPWYRKEIELTLDIIRDAGCIVEVNTRGLYQNKSLTPYPSPWILERLHQMEIPITLSSDAHLPRDLVSLFAETAMLLGTLGFRKLSTLRDGQWKQLPFNENGIGINP